MTDPFVGEQQPLDYRKLLAELFADAEVHGFGALTVGFVPHPGRGRAAMDYMKARLDYIAGCAIMRGDFLA